MTTTPDPQTVREIARIWFYEDADGACSPDGYTTIEAAQFAALADLDPQAVGPDADTELAAHYAWLPWGDVPNHFLLAEDDNPTGHKVYGFNVIGSDGRYVSWPDEQPQDERDARIAQLERELRDLRGTELNPSPLVLDAQSYGELRDEIAAGMGDGWDLDEAEISILIKYVRWLAAGQPRDEDGYPVRRETYPAVEERKPMNIGTGMPATTHLEAFGQCLRDAFGAMPYHVGSSIHGKTWRDVDVRIMLDDDRFDALFPGYAGYRQRDAWWALACAAISELGRQRTGLPIDFQVQRTSEANEKFPGARNPLFVGHAEETHRPIFAALEARDAKAAT